MMPRDLGYRPYFVKLDGTSANPVNNTNSYFMHIRQMFGIGQYSSKPNYADRIGGTLFVFNDRLYIGNSGSVRDISFGDYDCPLGASSSSSPAYNNDGGLIRSNNNDPQPCTGDGICNSCTDITPASANYRNYYSIILSQISDLTPALRPVPSFASFQGKLFMIRNACSVNMLSRTCGPTGTNCSDDQTCSGAGGTPVPQLWKCDPTNGGADVTNPATCESGEWSLVAENGSTGKTNKGNTNNTHITLLVTNGSQLYIGFNNSVAGIEVYKSSAANPSVEADFVQVGSSGLTDPVNNHEIYSATSVQDGVDFYIYLTTGKTGSPIKVYREKNN